MVKSLKDLLIPARWSPQEKPAQQEIKGMSVKIAEPVGTDLSSALAIARIKQYSEQIDVYKAQTAAMIKEQQIKYEAIMGSKGREPKDPTRLDMRTYSLKDSDGQITHIIIRNGNTDIKLTREEFMKKVEEGDILCSALYQQIVEHKLNPPKEEVLVQSMFGYADIQYQDMVSAGVIKE